MSKRTRRSTPHQFDAMVEYMKDHPQLINGKLSSSLNCAKRMKLWEELASTLNDGSLGPKKTVLQWRRVWIDLKSEVKEKIAELEAKGIAGRKAEILSPVYQRVADLLSEVEQEVELNERKKESRAHALAKIKLEEGSSESDEDAPAPLVISLAPDQNPNTYTESDSSNHQYTVQELRASSSRSREKLNFRNIISEAMETKARKRPYRKTEVEESEQLSTLVMVEKEKSDMLSAIAHALSTTNEYEEKRLKIEQDRNKLIQERNAIENERNELFKAFLEHMIEKSESK